MLGYSCVAVQSYLSIIYGTVMDVKRATENLSCPVCYQLFKNPKYLLCYHSYCEECLVKMAVQSKVTCPECRKETVLPGGGVKDLANNFFINRMVDDLVLKRKVDGEEKAKCDICDEDDPVVAYCVDCSLFQCDFCHEAHKRDKRSRGHNMLQLAELKSTKDLPLQAKICVPLCKDHDEQLKYYCETCEQLVCMYCTVKGHNAHNHETVKKVAEKYRNSLNEITAPLEDIVKGLSEAHEKIDGKMKTKGDEVNREIDLFYDELVEKLMEQKRKLKQEAHDMVLLNQKPMGAQLDQIECAKAEVLSMRELKDTLKKSSDQELMSARNQLIHDMQRLTDKYKKLNVQVVQSDTVVFVPSKMAFPQFGQVFLHTGDIDPHVCTAENLPKYAFVGQKVEFTITSQCRQDGFHCTRGGGKVLLQFESPTVEVTGEQVIDNNDGFYTASFVATQPGVVKIYVFMNGEPIWGNPHTVSVHRNFFAVSKPIKVLNVDGSMGEVWGIAFGPGPSNFWAVTDLSNHCVFVFGNHDRLFTKFGSQGNGIGQFTNPRGVTFDSDNCLYVADCDNHRVQKFSPQGNYLLQFGTKGSASGQLNFPVGVTVFEDKVYVTEKDNRRVSIFHCDGRFWQIIGKKRLPVRLPYDLAFNNDDMLVTDYTLHCVHAYTLSTQQAVTFGTEGKYHGQLKHPCGLTTDVSGLILVADTGNNRVTIFDRDGNCLHCFGSQGSDDGQFNCPRGITLGPNGNIYVTDSHNKRIQVFSCR